MVAILDRFALALLGLMLSATGFVLVGHAFIVGRRNEYRFVPASNFVGAMLVAVGFTISLLVLAW